jgi:predicted RNA-binding protein with RPS1 domain
VNFLSGRVILLNLYSLFPTQGGELVDVIHLQNGFVITKRAHDDICGIIRDLILSIDDKGHKSPSLKKTERLRLSKNRRSRINDGKVKLVERFISAIFPGPSADIIIVSKHCPFTHER